MSAERQRSAANRLEELRPALDEVIDRLRDPQLDSDQAYALVVQLCREVTYVARPRGNNEPQRHAALWARRVLVDAINTPLLEDVNRHLDLD